MTTQPFDPAKFKAEQRQRWDEAAPGWRTWWHMTERFMQPVGERLIELAGVRPGHRVLDIATGIGEPAVTAARRVGPKGYVLATDLSAQMVALGRERALHLGLTNIEFRAMDAEAIESLGQPFDAALCRFGLMFLPDVAGALRRIHGVLRPGGRFATAVWGEAAKVPMIALSGRVAQEVLKTPPPPPGAPSPTGLADQKLLRSKFAEARFKDVRIETLVVVRQDASTEDYLGFTRDVSSPMRGILANQPPEAQERYWQAMREALKPYVRPGGALHMENEAVLVVGTR